MPVTSADRDHAPLKLSLEKHSKAHDLVADNVLQKPNQAVLGMKEIRKSALELMPHYSSLSSGSGETICLFTAFAVIDPMGAQTTIEESKP
jgi:hypothetical protein